MQNVGREPRRRRAGPKRDVSVFEYADALQQYGHAAEAARQQLSRSLEVERVLHALQQGGELVALDRPRELVRSTTAMCSSTDGQLFASAHGDHTVKVHTYPHAELVANLEGHPRTPWAVRFHPRRRHILASGCLGGACIVWDLSAGANVRCHRFGTAVTNLSFEPKGGNFIAIQTRQALWLWHWTEETALPVLIYPSACPLHLVDFHPSGTKILIGWRNRRTFSTLVPYDSRLELFAINSRRFRMSSVPELVIPHVVAYNSGGAHFSADGALLAVCVPSSFTGAAARQPIRTEEGVAALRLSHARPEQSFDLVALSTRAAPNAPLGSVVHRTALSSAEVSHLTSVRFSARAAMLLLGFGGRWDSESGDDGAVPGSVKLMDVFRMLPDRARLERLRSVESERRDGAADGINTLMFAPAAYARPSDGVLCGTQDGRVRLYRG